MKHYIITAYLSSLILGCSYDDNVIFHNDISEYQGIWCDTILDDQLIYIEDFIVQDNRIEYILYSANTNIIHEKMNGTLILGLENKIGWNCISQITNTYRQSYWDVLQLSTYQMRLYSNLQGEHNYQRVNPSIDDPEELDTINEILKYKKYLPLSKTDLTKKFGLYNKSNDSMFVDYLTNHKFFDVIRFKENYDNDSIYSYILHMKDIHSYEQIINNRFTKIRIVNGKKEYSDADALEYASNVVIIDTLNNQLSLSPLKDYDYWPNVSHLLGVSIQEVKKEYGAKYVYKHTHINNYSTQYDFQTAVDGICQTIAVIMDENGVISRSSVWLLEDYSEIQEKRILHLLDCKYCYDRYENDCYYYYSSVPYENAAFIIRYHPRYKTIVYIKNS